MTPTGTATEQTTLGTIIELTERKRDLDRDLRAVKAQLEPLHAEMLDEFARRGESSARHAETGMLVYVGRRTWARAAGGDKDTAYDALRAAGLEEYADRGFNTHALSAYFRERLKARNETGDPVTDLSELLPPALQGVIELTEDQTINVRS